ncbi:hypothetical protein CC78DRAFT_533288 [Lojkania enalia]|uniref:N-acetyltransferase domain-containing protein n=1 Tax=Lojkania enalia TaxID=147567 RepID=A0A9P4N3G3_9PLEO|nr:hypothetical protein CC78DRAFT_533288 [Didymosphaeria enalia]
MEPVEKRADLIKIPTAPGGVLQTVPVEPGQRILNSEIKVELCEVDDATRIAEGLYTCFPEVWWARMEPPEIRPPSLQTRVTRLTTRIRPTFSNPNMKWIKAVLTASNEIVGVAGWMGPNNPIKNIWSRSAQSFYGWDKQNNWTEDEIEEMWKGASEAWDVQIEKDEKLRADLMGDEPHWYLAPLFVWPQYQGKGVGKLLLDWAIKQADATDPVTPLYLESMPNARALYMHVGFVPQGGRTFIRRGPAIVRGLEAEEDKDVTKEGNAVLEI